jgi:trans-aconitate 2-methyltransferase
MRESAAALGWTERLAAAGRQPLPLPRAYYDALAPQAARVDVWRTAYQHVLANAAAIVEFIRSTGLRPYLDPLSEPERGAFLADFTARIAAAYPPLADGRVLLQFPRLFIVAQR